jgi:hypothetical protein
MWFVRPILKDPKINSRADQFHSLICAGHEEIFSMPSVREEEMITSFKENRREGKKGRR